MADAPANDTIDSVLERFSGGNTHNDLETISIQRIAEALIALEKRALTAADVEKMVARKLRKETEALARAFDSDILL